MRGPKIFDEHARPKNRHMARYGQLLDSIQIMPCRSARWPQPTAGADDKVVTSQAMIYSVSWTGAAPMAGKVSCSQRCPAIRLASRQACAKGNPVPGYFDLAPPHPRPRAD